MSVSIKSLLIGLLLIFATSSSMLASEHLLGTWRTHSGSVEVAFFEHEGFLMSVSSLYAGSQHVTTLSIDRFSVHPATGDIHFRLSTDGLVVEAPDFNETLSRGAASAATLLSNNKFTLPDGASNGMITGLPKGPAKSTASIFRVYLYDLDQQSALIGSQRLDQEQGFVFENLRPGRYRVYFAAQGPTSIQPEPAFRDVLVEGGTITEQHVTLD